MDPTNDIRPKSDVFIYEDTVNGARVFRATSPFVVTSPDYKIQFRNITGVEITLDVSSFGTDKRELVLGPTGNGQSKGQVKCTNIARAYGYTGNPEVIGNSGPKIIVDI